MRYETAEAFRQALERRLLDRSRDTGESLLRLRKAVVFDRLLARLVVAAAGRWVLKGALALDFRLGERGRTTKDIDLLRRDNEDSATSDFLAAQSENLDDFFGFVIEKAGKPAEAEGGAVRYHVRAELGGRLFDEVLVDVGFLDPLRWAPELVKGPDLLSFAGLQSIEVPALPLEQQLAEKVHAYTRTYGAGSASSRVKDLVDMILVKRFISLRAERLRRALEATFESRGGPTLPTSLPPPPPDWVVPYRRLANEVGIDPDLEHGYLEAAALLTPVLGGLSRGRWVPAREGWNEE